MNTSNLATKLLEVYLKRTYNTLSIYSTLRISSCTSPVLYIIDYMYMQQDCRLGGFGGIEHPSPLRLETQRSTWYRQSRLKLSELGSELDYFYLETF